MTSPRNTPEAVEPEGLAVRPLEWAESYESFRAESIIGEYVGWTIDGKDYLRLPGHPSGLPCADFRAAAEDHLTKTILAALDLSALQAQKEEIERLRADAAKFWDALEEIDMRGKQYQPEDLADIAREAMGDQTGENPYRTEAPRHG